ncbi:hypothetical protein PVAP13_5KG075300 [Panicum virgatum]|uniref:Uncharacterized protein n=1 Tax=Panicum virgatum TaxID=38727 RepID=A0A8T0SEE4_PANVG|nr:hypothetical protein PVAP13_5KG075300 [Panicum virgatum]
MSCWLVHPIFFCQIATPQEARGPGGGARLRMQFRRLGQEQRGSTLLQRPMASWPGVWVCGREGKSPNGACPRLGERWLATASCLSAFGVAGKQEPRVGRGTCHAVK